MAKTEAIENIKDTVGGMVDKAHSGLDAAKEAFDGGADKVDRRYRQTAAEVRDGAERISANVRERLDQTGERLNRTYGQVQKKATHLQHEAQVYVNRHPGSSLLIAGGIGFVVGLAINMSRSR